MFELIKLCSINRKKETIKRRHIKIFKVNLIINELTKNKNSVNKRTFEFWFIMVLTKHK